MPVGTSHGPDGTRPSSDTSPATAVAVGVARAPDARREHEVCTVGVYEMRAVMHLERGLGRTGNSHAMKLNSGTHHIPVHAAIEWHGLYVARSAVVALKNLR